MWEHHSPRQVGISGDVCFINTLKGGEENAVDKVTVDKLAVSQAREVADQAYRVYSDLQDKCQEAEKDYAEKRKRFQALDYQLALTDGRLKKIPSGQRGKIESSALTLDQITAIAKTLGIEIGEDDET